MMCVITLNEGQIKKEIAFDVVLKSKTVALNIQSVVSGNLSH